MSLRAMLQRTGQLDVARQQRLLVVFGAVIVLAAVAAFFGTLRAASPGRAAFFAFVSVHVGALGVLLMLLGGAKALRRALLDDVVIFCQQLIIISLSGDRFETGVRKIVEVSRIRRRSGPIESLLEKAIERRAEFERIEDAILHIADLLDAREVRRAVQLKSESDRYGARLSDSLRDLVEGARISAIPIPYFGRARPRIGYARRHSEAKELFRLLLSFSQRLSGGRDALSCLVDCRHVADDDSLLAEELNRLVERLARGVSEEEAIARFGECYSTPLVDLFVQALILSNRSPRVVREMLDAILVFVKRELHETAS
jgi:hypothetical protein